MANNETAHELILQILKTRMTFRQTIQRVLRTNNVDMTFEMLQVMHRLWKKPGVSQQYLAEQTAKDKACLTNLINNLEKKGWVERRGNPTDRRNKQIYLTEEGERLALIIRKSKFPWFPERSVQFSGKRTKRSVQKKGCTQHL